MSTSLFKHCVGVFLVTAALSLVGTGFAGDNAGGRKVRTKVAPTYPELARRVNAMGTVKIEVVVAPNGFVKSTKVIGGHPLLINAAEEAVKKWKYEPASEETTTIVEFNFTPGM